MEDSTNQCHVTHPSGILIWSHKMRRGNCIIIDHERLGNTICSIKITQRINYDNYCGDSPGFNPPGTSHCCPTSKSQLLSSAVSCTTPNGRQGSCIDLRQCTELYNLVAYKRPLTTEDRTFLSQSQCGYYSNSPLVKVLIRPLLACHYIVCVRFLLHTHLHSL